MKNFAEKFKKAIKDKGVTQTFVCEKIGMSQDGIKKMIENDSIKVKTLEQICEVLDVPISYFIEVDVKPTGLWKRLVDEATAEAQKWKIRAYELEEQMGIGNFNHVSGRRGVAKFKTQNRKPVSFLPNYLRFHLHK